MASAIKFGTDGWRAIIADDFIFENVRRVSRAIANYIHRHEDPAKGVLLAYDTRFGSRRFAEVAAEQLADAGLQVRLANDYTPTPALSYAVKQMGAAGGELPGLVFEDAAQVQKIEIMRMRSQKFACQRLRCDGIAVEHEHAQIEPLRLEISRMKPR